MKDIFAKHVKTIIIPDEEIDCSDIPEQGEEFFRNARVVEPGSDDDYEGRWPKPK